MNVAYNMDCLEAMRKMPDNAFDLAVVDPPYGSGLTETGGCKGWFAKYHQDGPDNLGGVVEPIWATIRPIQTRTIDNLHSSCRKHERERAQGGGRLHYTFGVRKSSKNYENRRAMGREISKKSFRGTQPRNRNILKSCFVSHGTRLSGGATTSTFLRQGVSSSSGRQTFPKKGSAWHPLNMLGHRFGGMRK